VETQILQRVNEVSANLVRTPGRLGDLNSILQHIAQTAQDAFETDACVILAFNPITANFIGSQIVVGDLHVKNELLHDRPRPNGVTQQVLREGLVLVPDLDITPQYHNLFTTKEGFRSFAGIAIRSRHRKRPLGVIYLDFRQPKAFNSMNYEYFKIFATQATLLLQETWLEIHLAEVSRIGQEINHNLALVDDLFQELQKYVDNILDDSHSLLLGIYQSQTNTLDLHIREQKKTSFLNIPLQGTYKDVIETQTSRFIPELSAEAEHNLLPVLDISTRSEQKESLIVVPLTLRGEPLGVLSIQHALPKAYGQEDHYVLQLLANYIALALHNIRLYSSLTELNETGQVLTQQLESEQTLDATVEKIRDATKADIVVLYPYEPDRQRFVLPPRRSGTLLDSPLQSLSPSQPDDIAVLMLRRGEPIYARESTILYNKLLGEGRTRQGHFAQRERIRSTAVVPLQVGEEAVGVLFVNFRQPQRFDGTQKLLMEGLAHYAAIAIKNSQVFGTLSLRRMRELEALQKIDRELSQALDLSSILNTILSLAHERVEAEEASILLLNDRLQVLETAAAIGRHAESSREQMLLLHEPRGISSWVVKEKKPVLVNNLQKDLLWKDIHLPVAADIVSELDIPLLDGDEVVGVLNFESIKEGAFQKEDQDFLLTLAGQAVLAIKNGQAYEREKRLAEEGRVLNQISKEITSQLDANHIFDLILEKALELTHSTRGNLMIYDRDRNDVWLASERGLAEDKKGLRQSLDEGIIGYVARHKQLLNVDLSQPPWNEVYLDLFPGTQSELAVPMLVGDELGGVLNVESLATNNYSESDERLLQGLADLAVIALQNAQAFEREKRLVDEGRVLNEISREITSQLDPRHVFDLILDKALELTRSHMGNLMLYDHDKHDLWMAAERGVAKDKKDERQGLHQGIVGYVARHKRLLNVNLSQSPWNKMYLEFLPGAHSELAVPMLASDELHGVLNVESPNLNNFDESDERLLQGLADLAVVALQNAQAYEKEKRLAQESQVLNEISKEITSQLDYVRVFNLILDNALELTHSVLGSLHLYNAELGELRMMVEQGVAEENKGLRQKLGKGIVGYVADHKQLLNVGDVAQHPWNEIYIEFVPGVRSELAVPLLAGDELRGILNIESPIPNKFTEHDERLLRELAHLAVIALQNAEHYEKAEKEAQRFELLYQAGQELSKITDPSQLEQAYEVVVQIADSQSESQVVIYRYDEVIGELVLKWSSPNRQAPLFERIDLNEGLNGQVSRERRTIVVHDVDNLPVDVLTVKQSDPTMQSFVVTPILFKDRYYGNLGLRHEDAGHFRGTDIYFYEALAQQLAGTIYRLETAQERQEFEQRAQASEEMSLIGQSAFEVTHRLGNDLGLVDLYISDIASELEKLGVANGLVSKKLNNISQAVQRVLSFSGDLKQDLARLGAKDEMAGEPTLLSPRSLLEETKEATHIPANITICVQIEDDVAMLRGIQSLVADILRNLVANAIHAMPGGGTITLRSRNTGRYVALEVSDTGVGIAPERKSQIFGLFFSTKGSSGFGLWSARRNALRNHGDLSVESKLGEGTTFTLLLPRADVGTL
jgi:GAF domain-containing protein